MQKFLPGTSFPNLLIYGTAWKGEKTRELVIQAFRCGFRSFDTAAQPKHYREDLVGEAIRQILAEGVIERRDLFLQTKFCPPAGQDPTNIPYDSSSPLVTQVETSVNSSLFNLRPKESEGIHVDDDEAYIDCIILHSPLANLPLTLEAWRAMEKFVPHKVLALGVSNISLAVLTSLYKSATIKPSVVQNRFFPGTRFDSAVRQFCQEKNIIYQAFWTLSANPKLLFSDPVSLIARSVSIAIETALYGLILGIGNIAVLNGTTAESRMASDREGLAKLEQWKIEKDNGATWRTALEAFGRLIGEDLGSA